MKLIFLLMFLSTSLVSCSEDNTVTPETLFVKIIPEQRFVKVNDSISFSLYIERDENLHLEYEWSTDKGSIKDSDRHIKFIAPAGKDDVFVKVKLNDQFGNIYKDSVTITVSKQFIIFKADDLVSDSETIFPYRWNKFIEYIEEQNIKASIGVIGNSLASGSPAYFNKIIEYHNKGMIEFWNHGYDHLINGVNAKGEKYHEFKNSPLEYQKAQLERTQSLSKSKLGFYFKTFGAPANGIDHNTLQAMDAEYSLRIWFYGNPEYKHFNLVRSTKSEIEFPVHNPDFYKFSQNYDEDAELLVLQIHPNSWDETRFNEFYQVVEFLKTRQVTFINPYEYYKLVNDVADDINL